MTFHSIRYYYFLQVSISQHISWSECYFVHHCCFTWWVELEFFLFFVFTLTLHVTEYEWIIEVIALKETFVVNYLVCNSLKSSLLRLFLNLRKMCKPFSLHYYALTCDVYSHMKSYICERMHRCAEYRVAILRLWYIRCLNNGLLYVWERVNENRRYLYFLAATVRKMRRNALHSHSVVLCIDQSITILPIASSPIAIDPNGRALGVRILMSC